MLVYEDYFGRSYNYKHCYICHEWLPATLEYFYSRKDSSCGLMGYCIECNKERNKRYHKKHREPILKRQKRWHQTHKEQANKRRSQWNKDNPIKAAVNNRKRRARKRAAEGFHTAEDIKLHYRTQEGRCWWCQKELNEIYQVDHRRPLSRGGSDWPENLVVSCEFCNLSKHDKLPCEWCGRLL